MPADKESPLPGHEGRTAVVCVERETFVYCGAFLPRAAVTLTELIPPARPAGSDTGSAHIGADHSTNHRTHRPCDNRAGGCPDYCACDGTLLRICGNRKGGQGRKRRSDTNNENLSHDRLSSRLPVQDRRPGPFCAEVKSERTSSPKVPRSSWNSTVFSISLPADPPKAALSALSDCNTLDSSRIKAHILAS